MAESGWSVVATFGDRISAQALFGLLESEHLPCYFASNGAVPGLGEHTDHVLDTLGIESDRIARLHADGVV